MAQIHIFKIVGDDYLSKAILYPSIQLVKPCYVVSGMLQQSCEQPEGQNPTIVVMMSGLAVPRIQQQGTQPDHWDHTLRNAHMYKIQIMYSTEISKCIMFSRFGLGYLKTCVYQLYICKTIV